MQSPRDPRSIRPGLVVVSTLVLALLALGVGGVVTQHARTTDDDEEEDRGGRTFVLEPATDDDADRDDDGWARAVDDPGAEGSAREAWAQAFTDRDEPLPPLVEAVVDPQMSRYRAVYTEAPPPFTPIGRRGRVLASSGLDIDSAQPCEVRVLPAADSGFNCLVRVMCGETVVYPNRAQTAGYVACDLGEGGPSAAADSNPSVTDGDPAIAFDLARGTVTVRDADREGRSLFEVTLQLDPTALRVM
ncbi:hypothetical protein [Sandaracinus amylolyticus]|uniref:Uncharacterized protein n=1 Tax=Sandaracinus amylolyticus TaxID=927083 RepID=A0A0F6SHI7_9BACT|nr:hypothetical protein [Sandaracinus amylolyticus]AKF10514.1 hypothetical protein DB32_007663 [Sandaracinus amylolyticus]